MSIIQHVESMDDRNFITDMRLDGPDLEYYGLPAYYVSNKLLRDAEAVSWLKVLQLRKVDYDASMRSGVYVQGKNRWLLAWLLHALAKAYWNTMSFLYMYGRLFVPIPQSATFSWQYFTPYFLSRYIISRIRRKLWTTFN